MFREDFDPQDIFKMFFGQQFAGGANRGGQIDLDDLIGGLFGNLQGMHAGGPRRRRPDNDSMSGGGAGARVFKSPMGTFVYSSGGFGPGFSASFSTGGFNNFQQRRQEQERREQINETQREANAGQSRRAQRQQQPQQQSQELYVS